VEGSCIVRNVMQIFVFDERYQDLVAMMVKVASCKLVFIVRFRLLASGLLELLADLV